MDLSKSVRFLSLPVSPRVYLRLLFLLTLTACSGEDLGTYQVQTLEELAVERTERINAPSVSIAVRASDGQVRTVVHGVENLATGVPVTSLSLYRVGSLTKTFVAARILQMVEAGILSLDDTLEELLPAEAARLANYRPARIQLTNLLNHTSLLCSFTEIPVWSGKFTSDPTFRWSPEALLDLVAPYDAAYCNVTGQTWHYSNTNYVLLGKIIEKYDPLQRPYGQVLREELINPLGLTRTFVPSYDFPGDIRWMTGYVNWGFDYTPLDDITNLDWSFTWASGEIISTPSDLSLWIKSLLTPGVVLQGSTLDLMKDTVKTGIDGGYEYGLGMMKIATMETLGHAGGHPGFDCTAQYLPEFDQAVATCENRTLAHHQKSDTAFLGSVLRSLHPEKNYPLMPGTLLAPD